LLKNFESNEIQVSGLIVADYSTEHNHWNSKISLGEWLKENNIPAITGIDTRALTKKLRENGVMLGKIVVGSDVPFSDPNKRNLVAEVSVKEKMIYRAGNKKVLLVDCGAKNNIIRSFINRGVTVIRVPWNYDFTNETYDGLFISNGPGDPKQCIATIKHLQTALQQNKPIFGICLGHQLLALAAGADTYKLKYGHRGQNQPCIESGSKKCVITSQNHGYAVDETTLSKEWESLYRNANDNTNEGLQHKTKPFFSIQFHPEANPGPTDSEFLFDKFIEMVKKTKYKA
ncbi:MAG: glutamine-hydrolyzing carbamoyl-phosphate synthase small subunit, partial [Candidatus Micrarchaeota archaeon]|nr:glutamine-hydrolyzing carbamoyl-phosphate synthase small subunit [Candidatus Micrarchaeota archaeon]